MKRLKVMTVVGTRPEVIRLSRVICRLDESPAIEHILVHTGQNYDHGLNGVFFEDLGIRPPDHSLAAAGENAIMTVGKILAGIDPLLAELKPDAFLVLGDTNSALSVLAAKKRRIPVFHMEAGNRCFDERVPEELNRRLVDHAADINMPYSSIARDYLLREGIPPDRIIRTGSPMAEVLGYYKDKIAASDIVERLGLERGRYFVASLHREESVDSEQNLRRLNGILSAAADAYGYPIVFPCHPRTRKRIDACGLGLHQLVRLTGPLGFSDYNHLQINSAAVLSDSGTVSEESAILGFGAVNLREAHERPEAMEEACVAMTGLDPERVMQALAELPGARRPRIPEDYAVTNVSDKVVRIILSYTDYVKRIVWNE